jgi:transforming growth factor-beta-induced protein
MKSSRLVRGAIALASLSLVAAACGSDSNDSKATTASTPAATAAPSSTAAAAMSSSEICDADGLVKAVQGGAQAGTLEGMANDPVATAASNNPVLTTLVTAVKAAGLVDTLNSAEKLTVFAPTDCAFAQLDPATLKAALADPTGLLTTVLGFHVIAGQRLSSADLAKQTELDTFTGEKLSISSDNGVITVGGQAKVLVPDIQTANATVYLIDKVMIPTSVSGAATADSTMTTETMTTETMTTDTAASAGAMDSSKICDADSIVKAVQGGAEAGTLEGMADDPVATAASSNPVLTTLVAAVKAAGLVDTLNSADKLTVFAPTDCAFAKLDPATLKAALADPTGLLTTVLGYHVIAGQRLSAADLAKVTELDTFTGEKLPVSVSGDTITVGGQSMVIVGDIQTANATVFLIDTVMIPPSVG